MSREKGRTKKINREHFQRSNVSGKEKEEIQANKKVDFNFFSGLIDQTFIIIDNLT